MVCHLLQFPRAPKILRGSRIRSRAPHRGNPIICCGRIPASEPGLARRNCRRKDQREYKVGRDYQAVSCLEAVQYGEPREARRSPSSDLVRLGL
jgi:hypothetical protein